MTGSTDADRVRLAEIQRHHRHDVDLGRWDNDELDLYRMAEDGIAAREAVERVRRLHQPEQHPEGWYGEALCICKHGGGAHYYPCPTARALDGA